MSKQLSQKSKHQDLRMAHDAILLGDLRKTIHSLLASEIARQDELELTGTESQDRYEKVLLNLLDRAEKAELITGAKAHDDFGDLF